jgi:hypothetical protein
MFFGPVLTNEDTIDRLLDYRNAGGFTSFKLVTGWGLTRGWNSISRAQALTAVPFPIVRTTVGDPSNATVDPFLNPDKVEQELEPFIRYKPDLMVELGNEPNIHYWTNEAIWAYRYFLDLSITRIRTRFPRVHIIAPALIINDEMNRWLDILYDVLWKTDSIGVHAYEHYGFIGTLPAKTNQLQIANAVYPRRFINKPLVLTEFGINHHAMPKQEKLKLYRELLPQLPPVYIGATFYHLNAKGDIDPQYNIPLEAL